MTFARLLETGSGNLGARLEIEGLPIELVSDPALERVGPSLASTLAKTNDSRNLLPAPNVVAWTPASGAVVTTGIADPAGGTNAASIDDPNVSARAYANSTSGAYTVGHEVIASCFIPTAPLAHYCDLRLSYGGSGTSDSVKFRPDTGALFVDGTSYSDVSAVNLGAWWFVSFRHSGHASAGNVALRFYPAAGAVASFPSDSAAVTGATTIYGPRIADATADPVGADPLGPVAQIRDRIYCFNLADAGLVIDESVNIPDAVIEAQGSSIRLFETEDERLAQALCWAPDVERRLTTTLDIGDSFATLRSADGVETGTMMHLGTEALYVADKIANVLTVARGQWGTIPQKHWANAGRIGERAITNRPLRVRGRRCYLYLYGDGDDLTGDGTRVWTGHVASEPACDDAGTTWRIQLASIAERLKGKIGGEFESNSEIRGAYYSAQAPLYIHIWSRWEVGGSPRERYAEIYFCGFGETQQDFCDALNAEIALQLPTTPYPFAHVYQAVPTPDGQSWQLEVTLTETLKELQIKIESVQDGDLLGEIHAVGTVGSVVGMLNADGERVRTASVGGRVYTDPGGPIPRGHFGMSKERPYGYPSRYDPTPRRPYWPGGFPDTRLYMRVATDCDAVQIEWPHGETREYSIALRDDAIGYITLDSNDTGAGYYGTTTSYPIGATYIGSDMPTVRQIRSIAAAGSTIADLRDGLVANGAEYCNLTGQPFLSAADLADWSSVVAEASRGRAWLASRQYLLASSVDLEEMLQAEMRLYGLFPVTEADGRIGVRSIDIATSGGDPVDIDEEMVSARWSSMERGGQTVNRVVLKTGYDPSEDEWLGGEIRVENMDSYAQDHEDRTLEIEPRSRATGGDETIDPVDASEVLARVTDLFGFPHDFVTVEVPWTRFGLRLGDPVLFSAHHLPDYRTGQRPTVKARGIVVSRRWEIGEPSGTLRLLVHGLNVAGYAPTARIASATRPKPEQPLLWLLTLDPAMYTQPGDDIYGYWKSGDLVRIIKVDSESPGDIIDAVVDSAESASFTVITSGAWNPGSGTWELGLCPHGDATNEQRVHAYIAGADGLLDGGNPRVYAP